ncbi:unnamed protein product [Owenia fusiformis]|uniref:glutathione transferase n=1 Tax=Owenia fusiformis TaxID=6347 RepID=A0A8S4NLM7_OWEFU|nr:unnamed protein product [Owenia fusiformis]
MPVIFAYWKIRGLAQAVRLLLNYVGEEFEDKMYECGPAPDFSRECWYKEKYTLGLDFPNLPYYIDGDIKITQSNAILRTIARKHNLCGTTDLERAHCDMMADQAMDFRNGFVRLCYNPKYNEEMRAQYLKELPEKFLNSFSKYLGEKPYFCGENLTFVDFHMYELLDQHKVFEPTILNNYANLQAFTARFEALPEIKKYMASDKFMRRPINNPIAGFK